MLPRAGTLLLLLALGVHGVGCGGGSCNATSELTTVMYGLPGDGLAGLTIRQCDGTTTVVVRPGSPRDREVSVVIHELYHVTGYRGHAAPGCYTSEITQRTWPDEPCDEELALMAAVEGTFAIQVADPSIRTVVRDAILFWNGHVGRDLFDLLP